MLGMSLTFWLLSFPGKYILVDISFVFRVLLTEAHILPFADTKTQLLRSRNHLSIVFHATAAGIFGSGGYYVLDLPVLTHFAGVAPRK